jgi:hypothetical protein
MSKLIHIDKIEFNAFSNEYTKTGDLYINKDHISIIDIDDDKDFAHLHLYDTVKRFHIITKKRAIEIIEIINGD